MFFSIIIPAYNVELYLERCLSSCMNQNMSADEYEIILINDGSTDKSLEVAMEVTKNITNATIITQTNQGVSAARNHGLSVANGEYIWFVDADDWIMDNCIKDIYCLLKQSDVDIGLISACYHKDNKCIKMFSYSEMEGKILSGKEFIAKRMLKICAPFSIYKRSFLTDNQLQFKHGIYHEDNEFSIRSYYLAKRVTYIDKMVYTYYQTPFSITQVPNPKKSFDLLIIANSLYDFSKSYVVENDKPIFYNHISLAINSALYGLSAISDHTIRKEWEIKFSENKYLITVLLESSKLKYRMEGVLFKIFKNYIAVYQFIQLFNKRTYKK